MKKRLVISKENISEIVEELNKFKGRRFDLLKGQFSKDHILIDLEIFSKDAVIESIEQELGDTAILLNTDSVDLFKGFGMKIGDVITIDTDEITTTYTFEDGVPLDVIKHKFVFVK